MKSIRIVKSVRSVKSVKSLKSQKFSSTFEECYDFGEVIVTALRKFECPINVVANKVYKEIPPGSSKVVKKDQKKRKSPPPGESTLVSDSDGDADGTGDALIITAHLDSADRLVEVSINNYSLLNPRCRL
ncbi:uncharacterized protein LOC142982244 isoform X2 [Anticarsia gemmatalis]|uniref:uncharacterized protein LOC142982244 isoform X2 n=1 Tax=Anticarsia gemmatalis TaxID=129554 RepID=UPI003F777B87